MNIKIDAMNIKIDAIKVAAHHRAIKPAVLARVLKSMAGHGYNVSYPVTLDANDVLVDGRHRLTAAQRLGIETLPYVRKPEAVSAIRHSILCNADQTIGTAHDVFDYAELCAGLYADGWAGQQIADELGWSAPMVTYHANIRRLLHERVWEMARYGLTKNADMVNADTNILVNDELTKVNWRETHFRALLEHLPCENGDRAQYRAQRRAVSEIMARFTQPDKRFGQTQKKVTARWISQVAQRESWYRTLARRLEGLHERVPLRDSVDLLRAVYAGVYGDRVDERSAEKFARAVAALNEKTLGVVLYHDDALQRLPLLADGSIALVVTDPPYNVTAHAWDRIGDDEEYLEFTRRWLSALRPKLADDYHLFFFCAPEYQARVEGILRADGWAVQSRVVWWNRSLPAGRNTATRFAQTWQMIFHCGNHALNWDKDWSDERFDVQEFAAPNGRTGDGGYHPTPKPLKLIARLVRLGSKPGDLVLDLFAGGGTTGAAGAAVRQRRCILIEREDEFCQNIERRLGIRRE